MKLKTAILSTGEVIELDADTPAQMHQAWALAGDYEKAGKDLRKQLQPLVISLLGPDDKSEPYDGFMFRLVHRQPLNYDKSVMREVFDEDIMDLLCDPAKKRVDLYIAEHLDELGEASTLLRTTMVASGKPAAYTKREKL